jgi:hypothetical protein
VRDDLGSYLYASVRLKRVGGTKGWRGLHNEKLHNLYASPYIITVTRSRRMKLTGHLAHMGQMRNAHKILVGKPEGKRSLGRPRRRWVEWILRRIARYGMDSSGSG